MDKKTKEMVYSFYEEFIRTRKMSREMINTLADLLEEGKCTIEDLVSAEIMTGALLIPPVNATVTQELYYRSHPELRGQRDVE